MTPVRSTTMLMSGKTAELMMFVTVHVQRAMMIKTRTDCSRM